MRMHSSMIWSALASFAVVALSAGACQRRESPAIDVMRLLEERGAKVEYHDPYIPEVRDLGHGEPNVKSVPLNDKRVRAADVVVITTDHSCFDFARVVKNAKLVVDTRNATRKLGRRANVVKL